MTKFTGRSGRGGRRRTAIAVLSAVAILGGLVVSAGPSGAHNTIGGNFEIDADANLVPNPVAGHATTTPLHPAMIDWLVSGTMRTGVVTTDEPTGSGDDSFGQGTKEDTEVPTPVTGAIPPNKSDLKEFGLYIEDEQYLNLFWTRVQDPQGTTNMDFEFNKLNTIPSVLDGGNGVTVPRSTGDFLITYDLSKGGTVPTISLRTWLATDRWSGPTVISSTTADGAAIGSINRDNIIPASESGGLGELSKNTFGEASIDLEAAFGASCTEIGSAFLKSRSSDSFTAAVKDYIAPRTDVGFSNCPAATVTTTHHVYLSDSATVGENGDEGTLSFALFFKPTAGTLDPCHANYAVDLPDTYDGIAVDATGTAETPTPHYEATADGIYSWQVSYAPGTGSSLDSATGDCTSERVTISGTWVAPVPD